MTTQISINTIIAAPLKKAWDYYTKPEHIVNWNFASDDWQCPSASNDMRVGGTYTARMEAKDGSFGFDFGATYTAIDEGRSFTYVLGDNRTVKVDFIPKAEKTEIHILFDAETQNPIEMQRDGWFAILVNYKKYTESH